MASKFRESRDAVGRLSYVSGIQRLQLIQHPPLVELESGRLRSIGELFEAELSAVH